MIGANEWHRIMVLNNVLLRKEKSESVTKVLLNCTALSLKHSMTPEYSHFNR